MRAYTRTDTRTGATDLCALGENATYMQANTHMCAHMHSQVIYSFVFFVFFFYPLHPASFTYRSLFYVVFLDKTFTCFVIRPGHMPSQAPHTSLIMQMRGNVTPRQQMARDDNNGSTDQFQCLRLYRYGNNKNR